MTVHFYHFQAQKADSFSENTHGALAQPQTADTQSYQLAGEHSGAFSSLRARFFPRELVESKTKETGYLTYIHQTETNTTSNEC